MGRQAAGTVVRSSLACREGMARGRNLSSLVGTREEAARGGEPG